MQLFPAEESEFHEIVSLVNAAYRGIGAEPGWTSSRELIDGPRVDVPALRAEWTAKPDAMLLAYRDDEESAALGCVWLEPVGEEEWYLGLLAVHPEVQDRQIGRTILCEAEKLARERGVRRITLAVNNARQTLISWYVRRGYVTTGETRPYDDAYGTAMRDDLHLVVMERQL